MPHDLLHSVCPHDCPSTCALMVERLDSRTIGRIHGARDNPYTAGVICAKTARYAERQHHPDRLREPLLRTGEKGVGRGAFRPISWAEALDRIAQALQRVTERYGSEAVWPYFYAGTMGLVQRDGIERLRHVMRYSRQHSTICVALSDAGWVAGAGVKRGVDAREMQHSDLIIVWGGNPVATQVNVMTHIARARKTRAAKLVVVDPYRTGTAEQADLHLMLRPGTDGALACAVMHIIFREGFADWAYLRRYTDDPEGLERHLMARTPEWAAGLTGLSVAQITEFAHLYGRTQKSFLRIGYGFTRSRNGAANMHAVASLPAVTGAWQYEGGGALYGQGNDGIYFLDNSLIQGLDCLDPGVRKLDQSRIGRILTGDRTDLGKGPPVMALFIQNTNPLAVCPESRVVREGFQRSDLFVAVHEQFMTETAAMADIVLPATTFLEHDDLYRASGHSFLQAARKIVEPLGEARSNHWVISELARRLGARHPGFDMTEWEIIEHTLQKSRGVSADALYRDHWVDCALSFEEQHFLSGFGHSDGRFHFHADWQALGQYSERMPAFPDHYDGIDNSTAERPFRLVTAPARQFLNTSFTETPTSQQREGRPALLLHPEDCQELGSKTGDIVRIGNDRASLLIHLQPFDGLQRKVAVVEGIWPNAAFIEGLGINALVSAEPGAPNGGAVFHDTAIWIRPQIWEERKEGNKK